MIRGTLWGVPHGRPESANRPQEEFNRTAALVSVAPVFRLPILVRPDGFDPQATNVLLQGRTYQDAVNVLAPHEQAQVLLCFLLHQNQGTADGTGYHSSPGPLLNANKVETFIEEFTNWWADLDNKPGVYGWQLGNEVEFDRTGQYTHDKWWNVFERVEPYFPDYLAKVSPGNSGLERVNGELTLNGWLASTGRAQDYDIILDVHGNGESNDDFESELRELPDKYPVLVGCYEDRHPANDHNHAQERRLIAQQAGAAAYFAFGARTTKPPATTCRWGVNATGKKPREHVGVEGCDFKWNFTNADQLGIARSYEVEVNSGGQGNGGNASQSAIRLGRVLRRFHKLEKVLGRIPTAADLQDDVKFQQRYEAWEETL